MNFKTKYLNITILALTIFACTGQKKDRQGADNVAAVNIIPETKYGIGVDSFYIERKKVKNNEFLGIILEREGISSQLVYNLAENYKEVFDVRNVRVGDYYELFHSRDSLQKLAYFVYEKSIAEFVIYDFTGDEVVASTWHKEIETRLTEASGIINNSLWQTIVDQNHNPILSIELSEIYAWSVDFFGIAKGDRFKVVYEEEFVDSSSLGVKDIKYAQFKHKGSIYYAIPFEQGGSVSYFNEDGESLKRAFLKAPLRYSRISSSFSNSRFHPVLKRYRAHHGVDYAAPSGTPVQTIGDGTVIARAYQRRGGGNYIKIKHNSVYTTVYMHLKGFAKNTNVGQRVTQGQTIGYVGSTGLSTGPHLDFRVFRNGKAMNPLHVKSPPVEPISKANKAAFALKRDSALQVLKNISYPDDEDKLLAEEDSKENMTEEFL